MSGQCKAGYTERSFDKAIDTFKCSMKSDSAMEGCFIEMSANDYCVPTEARGGVSAGENDTKCDYSFGNDKGCMKDHDKNNYETSSNTSSQERLKRDQLIREREEQLRKERDQLIQEEQLRKENLRINFIKRNGLTSQEFAKGMALRKHIDMCTGTKHPYPDEPWLHTDEYLKSLSQQR